MNLRWRTLFFLFLFLLLKRSLFYFGVHILLFFDLIWFCLIFNLYFFHTFHSNFDIFLNLFIDIHFNSLFKKPWIDGCDVNLRFFICFFEVYFQIIIIFKGNLILIGIQVMKWIWFYLSKWFPYESMDEVDGWGCAAIEDSDLFF